MALKEINSILILYVPGATSMENPPLALVIPPVMALGFLESVMVTVAYSRGCFVVFSITVPEIFILSFAGSITGSPMEAKLLKQVKSNVRLKKNLNDFRIFFNFMFVLGIPKRDLV